MLACLERVFVALWQSVGACTAVLQEEVFCSANRNKAPPLAEGPEGGEVKSWI